MLVYNPATNKYVIDPHYLSILPFKKIYETDKTSEKEIGSAKLLWIYHMFNPHSPFRDYRNKDKSYAIVQSLFPKSFLTAQEKKLQTLIDEANSKNKDLDALSDSVIEGNEVVPRKKERHFIPSLKVYDPMDEDNFPEAVNWYKDHLQRTPLWYSYESYKEAMYNLSDIIRKSESSATNIRAASQELDTIPLKMEKMKQQAVKDEAVTLKVAGDRNIKRSERLETHSSKRRKAESTQLKIEE